MGDVKEIIKCQTFFLEKLDSVISVCNNMAHAKSKQVTDTVETVPIASDSVVPTWFTIVKQCLDIYTSKSHWTTKTHTQKSIKRHIKSVRKALAKIKVMSPDQIQKVETLITTFKEAA